MTNSGPFISARTIVAILLLAMVSAAAMSGAFRNLENSVHETASGWRTTEASGQLHLVEMDAASVDAIKRWPWPREHYARVVRQLDKAGVRSIAFDVDFSSRSNAEQDRILADALANATAEIILPTFGQSQSLGDQRILDALPISELRDHAVLGSVAVQPDIDGVVREIPLGTVTNGVARPSLSALIAKQSGSIGTKIAIDLTIDPGSIPRHSFTAIERAEFNPAILQGKDVLIGATAIEMGDRYVVPNHGMVPGVLVHAFAAETLYRGLPINGGWLLPLLLAGVMSIWIMAALRAGGAGLLSIAAILVLVVAWQSLQIALHIGFQIVPAVSLLIVAGALRAGQLLRAEHRRKQLIDAETGLPNRRALEQHLAQHPARYTIAAMIDGFDTLKAVIGQKELGTMIGRVEERLRATGCNLPICRIDDRALAWTTNLSAQELEETLQGIEAIMHNSVEIAGRSVDISLYFGIAESDAISEATHAASRALRSGDSWRYHERAEEASFSQQVSLMGELQKGIEEGQLRVFYQPKLELKPGKITSVEALIRWEHPTRGFLPPDLFIPLAEETGRIADLTLFVLRQTIADLRNWRAMGIDLRGAVNVSARLLSSEGFLQQMEQLITAPGVDAGHLILEVTESGALKNPDQARLALERFRSLGASISMDDYGTGQSTLSYIQNLPLAELKIDRSFVQFAHEKQNDGLLVTSSIKLAHSLGLKVVGEGVETEECLEFLRAAGCDYAQGYLIGKPMPAADLAALLQDKISLVA